MRYKPGQKEETRQKIIEAIGQCFRESGFSGIGIDGLAKAAGVTSGAFYKNFGSKKEAFQIALDLGLRQLKSAITRFQTDNGKGWWPKFAKFYITEKSLCDAKEACALQSLLPEVARADDATRRLFDKEFSEIIGLALQENDGLSRDEILAKMAMLVGGVSLARAVASETLAEEVIEAVRNAL